MYAAQYIDSHPEVGEFSSAKHWKSTTRNHMKKFIALNLLMELIQKPAIHLYWSEDPFLQGSVFNSAMSRNRFQVIPQFLHFTPWIQNEIDCTRSVL